MRQAAFMSIWESFECWCTVNAVLLCITQGNIGLQRVVVGLFSNAEHVEYYHSKISLPVYQAVANC